MTQIGESGPSLLTRKSDRGGEAGCPDEGLKRVGLGCRGSLRAASFPSGAAGEFGFRRVRILREGGTWGRADSERRQTTLESSLAKLSAQAGSSWPQDCDGCLGPCPHRYRLHFERDSREEVEKRKRAAREQVLQPVSAEVLELDIQEVYQPGSGA